MATDIALIEKREELKRRLSAGEYKTLVDVSLEWFDRLLRKVTRQHEPYTLWFIAVILILILSMITFAAVYVKGGLTGIREFGKLFGYGLGYGYGILLVTGTVAISVINVIIINQSVSRIFAMWRDDILDSTESLSSVLAFENWLGIVCNRRLHFLVTILVGLFAILLAGALASAELMLMISNGFIFGLILMYLIWGAFIYQFAMAILLSAILLHYHLKLFAADPASSELLSRLSGELSFFVYFVAFVSVFISLVFIAMGLARTVGPILVLILWLPIIAIFVLNQTSLSALVRRAKWKTLNEIQAKVEKLQSAKNFGDKETMDAINRLLDYHERVNKTRTSALDFRAYLNFINSLLIPLLAFILSNFELVKGLFVK